MKVRKKRRPKWTWKWPIDDYMNFGLTRETPQINVDYEH